MIFKEKERMLAVNLHSGAYPQGECGKAQGFLSLLRLVVCATKMTARTKVATLPSAATWAGTPISSRPVAIISPNVRNEMTPMPKAKAKRLINTLICFMVLLFRLKDQSNLID
ncbi:hypothetical protein [Pseudovibrio sp. SCP19]|uniref:hypothetical protein n=1 Tax=Pseudovibrio sp. SCP19 TaxID=3141374 RepID=UPI003334B33E